MLNSRYYIFIIFFLGLFFKSRATHNRAGEITYRWLFGYTYEIKVTTYTNIGFGIQADRCEDTLYFGDGIRAIILRSNGTLGSKCNFPAREGEIITSTIKKNEYVTTHTYGGPGNYIISTEDPNRNENVFNIPNSVNQVFYIESLLIIPTFGTVKNSSPVLTFPPIDNGCVRKCFLHNPGAYDADGDSLSYELTPCRGSGGFALPGYSYPLNGGGVFNVHPTNGTLTWCTPQNVGMYNIAMIIREWRKDDDGNYFLVGYILRDMQVDIAGCVNNPPVISPIADTCVIAGTVITKKISASDADNDILTLEANGAPFYVPTQKATFSYVSGIAKANGLFAWQTSCEHIRKAPYQVTIKASDPNNGTASLVDFKTFNVRVVPPAPLKLTAKSIGTSIGLTWEKPACQLKSGNKIERYCVYRKSNCSPWNPSNCETGVPAYTGYIKLGCTANMDETTFIDSNNGKGLSQGMNYSYLVVAVYSDLVESYASNPICIQLKRDIPLLINVDIKVTDNSNGSVFIRWIKPALGIKNLDTSLITGPYKFKLLHFDGFSGVFKPIDSTSSTFFAGFNKLSDTTFIHTGNSTDFPFPLNTKDVAHTYKIEFYANGQFVGNGQTASSEFLTLKPGDKQITLNWTQLVPWSNYQYYIFRKLPSQITYNLIDSTTALTYKDKPLVNGAIYCYKIQAKGEYSDSLIYHPLFNFSQEVCDKPIDKTPPCPPQLNIVSDCVTSNVLLRWNNPNHKCSDDAIKYNIYFSATTEADLTLFKTINNVNDTIYAFDALKSIAGCYNVTAVDSFGNESLQAVKKCVDNCPEYELPNVITVNNDGINDFFKAIKNKYIKDIDLKLYNRWGNLVYETTDPAFLWDGKVIQTKSVASEGTYFYVCEVNEIRVKETPPRILKGFLQIFSK